MTKSIYTPTWGEEIEQVTFFRNYWEAIEQLESQDQLELLHAMMQYCFCSIEPEFSNPYLNAMWCTLRDPLYKSCTKTYVGKLSGTKGGAPKGNTNARKNRPKDVEATTPHPTEDKAGEGESTAKPQRLSADQSAAPRHDEAGEDTAPTTGKHRPSLNTKQGRGEDTAPNPADEAENRPQATNVVEADNCTTEEEAREQRAREEELKALAKSFNEYWSIGRRVETDRESEWNAWKNKGERYRTAMMQFAKWWKAYDKSADKKKCITLWLRLKQADRESAIKATPDYVASTLDKRYRKDPYTWLNNKSWENEIITPNSADAPPEPQRDYGKLKEQLKQGTLPDYGYPAEKYAELKEQLKQGNYGI